MTTNRKDIKTRKPLKKKKKRFCELYVESFNAYKAYLEAYKCEPATANSEGSRLLKREDVRKYIQELIEEHVSEDLTPNRILYELMDIAFSHDDETIPPSVKLQALQHLSKLMGMEVTKIDANIKTVQIVDDLNDEDE